MVRQIFGGPGALVGVLISTIGAATFGAFILMLALSIGATALSPLLHRSGRGQRPAVAGG